MAEQERVRAARQAAEAARPIRDLEAAATPETVRKLRRDVIQGLRDDGRLGVEQLQAAQEIMRVWQAVTAGLWPKAQTYERVARGADATDWPAALKRAYNERYLPWVREADKMLAKPGVTFTALVVDMVIDNAGPKQIEAMRHIDSRKVVRCIQASLHRYAELGGWLKDADPVAAVELARINAKREELAA